MKDNKNDVRKRFQDIFGFLKTFGIVEKKAFQMRIEHFLLV